SKEYLLEFTSEYGIPESLHLDWPQGNHRGLFGGQSRCLHQVFRICKLSHPPFTIPLRHPWALLNSSFITVSDRRNQTPRLPEELEQPVLLGGRENIPHSYGVAHKRPKGWDAISRLLFHGGRDDVKHTPAPNPTKVKIETRPRATHEVQLLTVTANHVLDMENTTEKEQTQDGLSHKIPHVQNPTTVVAVPEPDPEKEVAAMGPQVNKRRRKRGNDGVDANAPPKVLMKDHVALRPAQSTLGGKFLAAIGLDVGSTLVTPATQETPSNAKSVNDPDPLSCAKTQPCPKQDVAQ
ncbi:hypothetical protein Tco_1559103, partial [Tanacetum coccineum]